MCVFAFYFPLCLKRISTLSVGGFSCSATRSLQLHDVPLAMARADDCIGGAATLVELLTFSLS